MSGEVERFLGASEQLARRSNLPARGLRQESFDRKVTKVVLGSMLAQVAIVPSSVSQIQLMSYDGDEEMLAAVRGRLEGRTLYLEGQIPFKPGGGRGHGAFFSSGNVTIGHIGGSVNITGGGGSINVDGREVDLSRSIRFGLMVPKTMNVKISEMIGAVGIADDLNGELDFSPSIRAELSAGRVRSLIGEIRGSGRVTLGSVVEDADLQVSGSGDFVVNSVGGAVQARVSGAGNVTINGGESSQLRATVSGCGNISHNGTVKGDARISVSGVGNVTVKTVRGEVDQSVRGSGRITTNGQTHRSRW